MVVQQWLGSPITNGQGFHAGASRSRWFRIMSDPSWFSLSVPSWLCYPFPFQRHQLRSLYKYIRILTRQKHSYFTENFELHTDDNDPMIITAILWFLGLEMSPIITVEAAGLKFHLLTSRTYLFAARIFSCGFGGISSIIVLLRNIGDNLISL